MVYVSNATSTEALSIPDVATASPCSGGSLLDADVYRAMRHRLKLEAAELRHAIRVGVGNQMELLRSREAQLLGEVDAAMQAKEDSLAAALIAAAMGVGSMRTYGDGATTSLYAIVPRLIFKQDPRPLRKTILEYGSVDMTEVAAVKVTESDMQHDSAASLTNWLCMPEVKSVERTDAVDHTVPSVTAYIHALRSQCSSEWLSPLSPASGERSADCRAKQQRTKADCEHWLAPCGSPTDTCEPRPTQRLFASGKSEWLLPSSTDHSAQSPAADRWNPEIGGKGCEDEEEEAGNSIAGDDSNCSWSERSTWLSLASVGLPPGTELCRNRRADARRHCRLRTSPYACVSRCSRAIDASGCAAWLARSPVPGGLLATADSFDSVLAHIEGIRRADGEAWLDKSGSEHPLLSGPANGSDLAGRAGLAHWLALAASEAAGAPDRLSSTWQAPAAGSGSSAWLLGGTQFESHAWLSSAESGCTVSFSGSPIAQIAQVVSQSSVDSWLQREPPADRELSASLARISFTETSDSESSPDLSPAIQHIRAICQSSTDGWLLREESTADIAHVLGHEEFVLIACHDDGR